jgi:hypothetical protein
MPSVLRTSQTRHLSMRIDACLWVDRLWQSAFIGWARPLGHVIESERWTQKCRVLELRNHTSGSTS